MQVHVTINNRSELPHCQGCDDREQEQERVGVEHDSCHQDDDEQCTRDSTYNQILHASLGLSVSVDGSEEGVVSPCPFSLAFSAFSMTA